MVPRSELKGHAVCASSSLAPSKHATMRISREPELALDWPAPDNSDRPHVASGQKARITHEY